MYAFKFQRPATVRQAASLLAKNEEAKLLAGGHTLIPTMKLRLASPSMLIDLSKIEDLTGIELKGRSVVIGAPVQLAPTTELDRVEARVRLNGNEVATGLGSAVLGNPLNSIRWLAEKLSQHGRRLRSDDIIMTGSFARQFPLQAGDVAVAEFSGIGRVEVRIAKA